MLIYFNLGSLINNLDEIRYDTFLFWIIEKLCSNGSELNVIEQIDFTGKVTFQIYF